MTMNKWIMLGMIVCLFSSCGNAAQEVEEIPHVSEVVQVEESESTKPLEEVVETAADTDAADAEASAEVVDEVIEEVPEPEPIDPEALKVNEQGHIMVVMYHGIMDNPPYHRLKEDFIKDLTYMYDHGYRTISMSDYLSGHIDIEAGMTPIVLTFDDGLPSTFSMTEVQGELVVNPDTAVGLLESFAVEYPDFGKNASFYIHGNASNFRGDGTDVERLEWLTANGYEIGNHSNTHANFKKLNSAGLLEEVGKVDAYVNGVLPGYKMTTMTYPFGARPSEGLIPLLSEGVYEGYELNYEVAFREGPSGTFYPPVHVKFSPYNAPRVRGSEGEVQDMWWFFEHYEANPSQKYVSDGNPDTITVPSGFESNIKEDMKGIFEVIMY